MTDALALPDTPAGPPQTVKAHVRTPDGKRLQITRKQKLACDATVWRGASIREAAAEAGLTTDAVRKAFALPHVIRYLREQRQVFREHARAQNIHVAVEIRSQTENQTARVQAMKFIESPGGEEASREGQASVAPGIVVTINLDRPPVPADDQLIEVNASPAALEAADNDPQP